MNVCELWWARLAEIGPRHEALLCADERTRCAQFVRRSDRLRFTGGVAITRLVLGELLDVAPTSLTFDRTCPSCGDAHGKPTLADRSDVQWSVSHSGDYVVVAARRGDPVGMDLEQVRNFSAPELARLAEYALAPAERNQLRLCPPEVRAAAFATYWTRKEAVLKMAGDGIGALADLVVSPPHEAPEVLCWRGVDRAVTMAAITAPAGYSATLAVAGSTAPRIVQRFAARLLRRQSARPAAFP